jgi:fucokinase
MTDLGASAFLRQAYENNWRRYQQSLQAGARGWDVCILTASDERQATVYRNLLAARSEAGLLPSRTRFVVLADPDGQRIGSGGATLRALALWPALLSEHNASAIDLRTARVLVIHSGGDSKRLPHCSATGKLLARVPRQLPDGRASTVLDEFLIGLTGLAFNVPPGVLVVSGDVLLVFDHLQLSFQQDGAIGVAAAAPLEMARRHGVYVSGERSRAVRAYLHKPTPAELKEWQAIAGDDTVQIDTGLLWFDAACAGKLLDLTRAEQVARLCGLVPRDEARPGGVHLYADLLFPLARSTTFDRYLTDASDGPATDDIQAARRVIWQALRETPLSVERLQPAFFAHLGTSLEYWRLLTGDAEAARTCVWTNRAASWRLGDDNEQASEDPAAVVINSVTASCAPDAAAAERQPALVVDSCLGAGLTWQGASLVASVQAETPLTLTRDVAVHQLPMIGGGYLTQVYGIHDDPKRAWDDPAGGFVNQPWAQWLRATGVAPELVWPDLKPEERTLWNARLFAVAADRQESLALSLPLQDDRLATPQWREQWQRSLRLSLARSSAQADVQRVLDEHADIEDIVAARRFQAAVLAEQPASQARMQIIQLSARLPRRIRHAGSWFAAADPVVQLRGYASLAVAAADKAWEDKAFSVLSRLIQSQTLGQNVSVGPQADSEPPAGVRVEACARVDFGGGWTDTPPYSIEQGGTVLNGAITLHGAFPIVVEAERLAEPALILHCRDIGATAQPATAGEALAYTDLSDPFALLKAALVLRGIVTTTLPPYTPLQSVFGKSGGMRLSTQTSIPRGSGLGTSSILAGAVLACLARFQGQTLTDQALFDEVLCLEQMLTTGGGWQDQVGGLVGGIKLVSSAPGLPQKLTVSPVQLAPAAQQDLAQRFLLVYTGQQRLAKDLLRNVMGRWMERDPEMVGILRRIAELALEMRQALQRSDLDEFGRLLGEHWLLNKRMDPGCTNTFIDGLFAFMQPYICGGKLAGAGGGGFAAVVARDLQAAHDLARALADFYPGTPVAVWPCGVPDAGLRVHIGPLSPH